MTDIARLSIRADSKEASTATAKLAQLERQGARTEKATDKLRASFRGLNNELFNVRTALGGLTIGVATAQVSRYADAWINATNRLKLATKSEEELAKAQQDSFDIAQRTRAGLKETVELYSKIQLTAGQYIQDQNDLARITETINKAVAVSGVSAESAAAAIIQLTQGFSGGVLRGQEFNSVIEQTPRLATLIADGIGVARSEIRALAMDGALTADVVIKALRSQASVIDGEFNDTVINISQSWSYLNNVLIRATGNLDDVTGASRIASSGIKDFADAIDELAGDTERLNNLLNNTQTLVTLVAGLYAGRYVGAIAAVVAGKVSELAATNAVITARARDTAATYAQIAAEVALLKVQRDALAASILRVQNTVQQTAFRAQLAKVTTALAAAEARLATASTAAAAATTAASVGTRALAVATTALKTALAFLGGPVGVAVLAGLAIYEFGRRSEVAKKQAFDLATNVDTLAASYRNLSVAQRSQRVTELNMDLTSVRKRMTELRTEINEATKQANKSDFGIARVGKLEAEYKKLGETLAILSAEQQALFKVGEPDQAKFETLKPPPEKLPTPVDEKELERERKRKAREEKAILDRQLAQAKARADEFEQLRQSLRTEEEVIGESYDRRYAMILENTRFFGAAQRDLLDRLNKQFATDVLEGFGSPSNSEDRFTQEIARLQEQFEARRQLILENTQLTEEERTELELELTRRRNEQLDELEKQRQELTLKNTKNIFGGLLSLAKTFGGESTSLYRTLFAASKAFAIADATVKGVQSVQKAWAEVPYPANIAAAAAAGVTAAANVASIASTSYAGAFDNGGEIPAGQFGLVGEFGPELVEGPMTVRSRRETADAFKQAQSEQTAPQQQGNNITLVNLIDPSVVEEYLRSDNGEEVVLNVIRNNPEVIKQVGNA